MFIRSPTIAAHSNDPCNIYPISYDYPQVMNTFGRSLSSSQAIVTGQKTLTIIGAGQSLICNSETGSTGDSTNLYTATNGAAVQNLNLFDGAIYSAVPPLLGCSAGIAALSLPGKGGHWMIRLADKLINAGICARVILVPIGVDSSPSKDWTDGEKINHRIAAVAVRLAARGLTADAVLWQQGESDTVSTQADYTANLTNVIARFRAQGIAAPFFVATSTWLAGVTNSAVQAAQAALVNHASLIWAGANTDGLNATNRQADNTHLNATGADANATLWKNALAAYGAPFV